MTRALLLLLADEAKGLASRERRQANKGARVEAHQSVVVVKGFLSRPQKPLRPRQRKMQHQLRRQVLTPPARPRTCVAIAQQTAAAAATTAAQRGGGCAVGATLF